ncbi:MAG: TetR/AcrR family transcriptional regulator [Deltaproteobacteria bacterium]|nr:TetR/AcrR family transcriptional regulator [Deltaproteobacteria bacterium]
MAPKAADHRQALIEATARLLERRSPDALGVREIAEAAGVNHGLVHRYFGSKQALVEAAIAHVSGALHAADPALAGMSAKTFAYFRHEAPELPAALARACLDGDPALLRAAAPAPEQLTAILAPIAARLRQLGADPDDAPAVNGLASAAILGWFAFRPLLTEALGLGPDADERVERLLAAVDALVAAAPAGR